MPIEKIKPRNINEFADTDTDSLAESIRLCGLINPLSVVYHEKEDIYIISSGHRRYAALKSLHEQYPDVDDYKTIDCSVYEVTDDEFRLSQGLPYISSEQEEAIYRDSNLENRQLSYTDVAHQIRYIVKKFDNPDYIQKLKDRAVQTQGLNSNVDYSKRTLIMSVLAESHYEGWNRETIRQYLKIQEAGREDLLDKIESGEMTVYAAYKETVESKNQTRNRKTNKLSGLSKAIDQFKEEAKDRTYSEKEIKRIRNLIFELELIVKNNNKK